MTGIHRGCALALLIVGLTPLAAFAQLGFTQYVEDVSVSVGGVQDAAAGPNIAQGDDVSASVPGGEASISFDTATTPDWMTANAQFTTRSAVASAEAFGTIDFKFTLNQLVNPPVAISAVPMTVTASGHVSASRSGLNVSVDARAGITLIGETSPLVDLAAETNLGTGVSQDAFSEAVDFQVSPGEVVSVSLLAHVMMNGFSESQTEMSGQGDAFIDPVFEVSGDLIPGTSTRYDEVYAVEFSTGWDDATGGVPISGSPSVGQMKARFGN